VTWRAAWRNARQLQPAGFTAGDAVAAIVVLLPFI
jgi:hypothetical protein